jgi:hypothetical protein
MNVQQLQFATCAFRKLDTNNNGYITVAEFEAYYNGTRERFMKDHYTPLAPGKAKEQVVDRCSDPKVPVGW